MMLPGVEVARKRRVHYHEIQAMGPQGYPPQSRQSAMAEPALAARIRLEEKLRGPHSNSRWNRLIRDTESSTYSRQPNTNIRSEARSKPINPSITDDGSSLKLKRCVSEYLCAVCLEAVRVKEKVTWLPCSHKYHSDCVLPWLASHPDCPCCRTVVPPVDQTVIS